MRPVPALLIALALPALCACNQVYSRQPLVAEARQQGDPEFRPGLWTGAEADDLLKCPFDIRKRRRDWPDCAAGIEVRRGQMFIVSRNERTEVDTYRLVDGQPILMQLHLSIDAFKDPRVPLPKDTDNPFYGWTYAGVRVLKTDAADRITQAELAPAQCGPLPPQAGQPSPGNGPAPSGVTSQPFAGLKIVGNNCVADGLDTVKNALARSAALKPPTSMRWVRDEP